VLHVGCYSEQEHTKGTFHQFGRRMECSHTALVLPALLVTNNPKDYRHLDKGSDCFCGNRVTVSSRRDLGTRLAFLLCSRQVFADVLPSGGIRETRKKVSFEVGEHFGNKASDMTR